MNIDFIITYVDGTDENWLKKRKNANDNTDAREIRYRDWGTLKYIFRSIEKFAPFVRYVYFVTDGQVPDFLNTDYEKLIITDHKDFIPEEYLPTFNSSVIEMFFHKIDGLSDRFVYFNDDMFLTSKTKPRDFFKHGLPRDSAVLNPVICYENGDFSSMLLNDVGIINTHFDIKKVIRKNPFKWFNLRYGKDLFRTLLLLPWRHFTGFYEMHIPTSYLKKTYEEVWENEEEYLKISSSNKFRNYKYDINQWLIKNWQLCSGKFSPRSTSFGKSFVAGKDREEYIKAIINSKYKTVCINDCDGIDFETEKRLLTEALDCLLPDVSRFEKR